MDKGGKVIEMPIGEDLEKYLAGKQRFTEEFPQIREELGKVFDENNMRQMLTLYINQDHWIFYYSRDKDRESLSKNDEIKLLVARLQILGVQISRD